MPWVKRAVYEEWLRDFMYARADLVAKDLWVKELQNRIKNLEDDVKRERERAENSVDELLKSRTMAEPISTHSPSRQRVDPAAMDNVFEEEDEDAVKRLQDRIEVEGPGQVYADALEETYE